MWKNVGWLAKKHGVSRITIGNWIRDGRYERVERTKGGHYRVWVNDPGLVIGYARVSSRKQLSSIDSQTRLILKQYPGIDVISDVGSGFNFKRRSFCSLLDRCLSGVAIEVVCVRADDFTQIGFSIMRRIIRDCGGDVIVLENAKDCK